MAMYGYVCIRGRDPLGPEGIPSPHQDLKGEKTVDSTNLLVFQNFVSISVVCKTIKINFRQSDKTKTHRRAILHFDNTLRYVGN